MAQEPLAMRKDRAKRMEAHHKAQQPLYAEEAERQKELATFAALDPDEKAARTEAESREGRLEYGKVQRKVLKAVPSEDKAAEGPLENKGRKAREGRTLKVAPARKVARKVAPKAKKAAPKAQKVARKAPKVARRVARKAPRVARKVARKAGKKAGKGRR